MNKVILSGRLTRDPEVTYSQSENPLCIARYSLAVDDHRHKNADGDYEVDFPRIVAFGKAGQFAETYLKKGMKIEVVGRLKTGNYTRDDGTKVYTTDVYAEDQEFAESKSEYEKRRQSEAPVEENKADEDIDDGLPFV